MGEKSVRIWQTLFEKSACPQSSGCVRGGVGGLCARRGGGLHARRGGRAVCGEGLWLSPWLRSASQRECQRARAQAPTFAHWSPQSLFTPRSRSPRGSVQPPRGVGAQTAVKCKEKCKGEWEKNRRREFQTSANFEDRVKILFALSQKETCYP